MSKLIFLDVDGTIVPSWQRPSRVTVEAIRAARANGHKVFISTGRVEADIPEYVRSIGFDGGIYSAGGRVVVNGTEILNRPMPAELVQQIIDALESEKVAYMLESVYGTYLIRNGQLSRIDVEKFYTSDEPFRALEERRRGVEQRLTPEHRKHSVYKICFLTESEAMVERISEKLGSSVKIVHFNVFISHRPLITGEISAWGIDKGMALNCVCQHLNVDPADCIAFGDSMNDAEILQTAGIGIAMANSEAGVKEIADQVCESCEEDGVAKALARMKLI